MLGKNVSNVIGKTETETSKPWKNKTLSDCGEGCTGTFSVRQFDGIGHVPAEHPVLSILQEPSVVQQDFFILQQALSFEQHPSVSLSIVHPLSAAATATRAISFFMGTSLLVKRYRFAFVCQSDHEAVHFSE